MDAIPSVRLRACRLRLFACARKLRVDAPVCDFGEPSCEKSDYGETCEDTERHGVLLVGLIVP